VDVGGGEDAVVGGGCFVWDSLIRAIELFLRRMDCVCGGRPSFLGSLGAGPKSVNKPDEEADFVERKSVNNPEPRDECADCE